MGFNTDLARVIWSSNYEYRSILSSSEVIRNFQLSPTSGNISCRLKRLTPMLFREQQHFWLFRQIRRFNPTRYVLHRVPKFLGYVRTRKLAETRQFLRSCTSYFVQCSGCPPSSHCTFGWSFRSQN